MDRQKTREYYTRQEAIKLLGFQSTNAFLQMARKHPEVFANINPNHAKHKHPWYNKAKVDEFARTYGYFIDEKP